MRLGIGTRIVNCARSADNQQLKYNLNGAALWNSLFHPRRCYHQDERSRYSGFWIPSFKIRGEKKANDEKADSNVSLVRAGFFRQAYSGVFHLLPLGLRVQNKIERLLDKHMNSLQASKVSLSSVSSQDLWSKSGRLAGGADVFKFSDRKGVKWLLSPTHEEEITELVGSLVQSYRDLPVRLYQVSRKYRDEPRPRQGLLRGREFLMKDLYTFDVDARTALQTYDDVRAAYKRFFDELKMPYIVANADSGNMGGDVSHEYHLPSVKGEDSIISCSHCDYVKNEELVRSKQVKIRPMTSASVDLMAATKTNLPLRETNFITGDRKTLVKVYCKSREATTSNNNPDCEINPYAIKAAIPQVALGVENPTEQFFSLNPQDGSILYMFDDQISVSEMQAKLATESEVGRHESFNMFMVESASGSEGVADLVKLQTGDQCPACSEGRVKIEKAIEIGHTFHLGTRYSEALNARVAVDPGSKSQHEALMQMGCHGIGVSRLIAASASALSDNRGLNWPRVMAPFEVVIIPHQSTDVEACAAVYDQILKDKQACNDAIIDDRETDWLQKLRDADLIGYPVIIFLGKAWRERGEYEVQCRRLNVKQNVSGAELSGFVGSLLEQL
jgi:prolyl-tRNA synthetase